MGESYASTIAIVSPAPAVADHGTLYAAASAAGFQPIGFGWVSLGLRGFFGFFLGGLPSWAASACGRAAPSARPNRAKPVPPDDRGNARDLGEAPREAGSRSRRTRRDASVPPASAPGRVRWVRPAALGATIASGAAQTAIVSNVARRPSLDMTWWLSTPKRAGRPRIGDYVKRHDRACDERHLPNAPASRAAAQIRASSQPSASRSTCVGVLADGRRHRRHRQRPRRRT